MGPRLDGPACTGGLTCGPSTAAGGRAHPHPHQGTGCSCIGCIRVAARILQLRLCVRGRGSWGRQAPGGLVKPDAQGCGHCDCGLAGLWADDWRRPMTVWLTRRRNQKRAGRHAGPHLPCGSQSCLVATQRAPTPLPSVPTYAPDQTAMNRHAASPRASRQRACCPSTVAPGVPSCSGRGPAGAPNTRPLRGQALARPIFMAGSASSAVGMGGVVTRAAAATASHIAAEEFEISPGYMQGGGTLQWAR